MVRITVRTDKGDLSSGSAFHIGDGWLVTAAHVVNGGDIEEIVSEYCHQELTIEDTILHSDDRVDIALLKTNLDLTHYLTKTTMKPDKNYNEWNSRRIHSNRSSRNRKSP